MKYAIRSAKHKGEADIQCTHWWQKVKLHWVMGSRHQQYLLWIKQVVIQCFLLPNHSHTLVSRRVRVTRSCTRLPPKQTIQVRPCIRSAWLTSLTTPWHLLDKGLLHNSTSNKKVYFVCSLKPVCAMQNKISVVSQTISQTENLIGNCNTNIHKRPNYLRGWP